MYSILDGLETRTSVLKVEELADILRVSQDTIYDLSDQGAIPSFAIGKQRRFDPKTVAYWIRKKDPTFCPSGESSLNRKGATGYGGLFHFPAPSMLNAIKYATQCSRYSATLCKVMLRSNATE
jgi:excisionase family DNA binding protein